jgi:hypothetical protein
MRPTVEEQLEGIRRILEDVVVPQVNDPYAADVLAGALATLEVLAEAGPGVVEFMRWDTAASLDVLAMVDVSPPTAPDDPLDLAAVAGHHAAVRALLEASVPLIREHADADRAFVSLMEERCARYPFVARYRGGTGAHAAR